MLVLALLRAFRGLPPEVRELVVGIVRAIAGAEDQRGAARRALEEAARVQALDERLRREMG